MGEMGGFCPFSLVFRLPHDTTGSLTRGGRVLPIFRDRYPRKNSQDPPSHGTINRRPDVLGGVDRYERSFLQRK